MIRQLIFPFILFCALQKHACAQSLDPGFNITGSYQSLGLWQKGGSAAKVLVQPDDKIVAVGMEIDNSYTVTPFVYRMHPNGAPDISFGVGGRNWINGYSFLINPMDAALQPDGKIVLAGMAQTGLYSEGFIARFLANGFPDTSFSQDGIAFYAPEPVSVYFKRVAIQPDGQIVAGGMITDDIHTSALVARFNPDGSPDAAFGVTKPGFTYGNFQSDYKTMNDMAIQQDGRILFCGDLYNGTGSNLILVQRYLPSGIFDTSFASGGEGTYKVNPVSDNIGNGIVVTDSGNIFVGGYTITYLPAAGFGVGDGIYLCLDSLGNENPAFAGTGKLIFSTGQMTDVVVDLLLQPDGKVLGLSYTDDHPHQGGFYLPDFDIGISRVNPDGSLDSLFGTNGVFIQPFSLNDDVPRGGALQPDGKILVAGENDFGALTQFNVSRFGFTASGLMSYDADFFQLFPNPGSDVINVRLPEGATAEVIQVYDHTGRCVLSEPFSPRLDVSALSNGTYSVHLLGPGVTGSGKLIILR